VQNADTHLSLFGKFSLEHQVPRSLSGEQYR
jgi:hypothetical protein